MSHGVLKNRNLEKQQVDKFHRITEWARLEGTTVVHLVEPLCSGRIILEHMVQGCDWKVL